MTRLTVASLNTRGVPLTGSQLAARCQAIGAFFEAGDADVVCFQEVVTYYHLGQLARQMRSFRHVVFRRTLWGPAGDVVTFSRRPVASMTYRGYGAPPPSGLPLLARVRGRLKGVLVTRLAHPAVSVVNTHPLANTDGNWSPGNRFYRAHRAQLAVLEGAVESALAPVVVCGDFNIARDSALFGEFIGRTGLADAFEGTCPATFRPEYLPAGRTPRTIDFILTGGEIKAESAEVVLNSEQDLPGGAGPVSDHLGLRARLHLPGV